MAASSSKSSSKRSSEDYPSARSPGSRSTTTAALIRPLVIDGAVSAAFDFQIETARVSDRPYHRSTEAVVWSVCVMPPRLPENFSSPLLALIEVGKRNKPRFELSLLARRESNRIRRLKNMISNFQKTVRRGINEIRQIFQVNLCSVCFNMVWVRT